GGPHEVAVVGGVVAVDADGDVDARLHHLGHLADLGHAVGHLQRGGGAVGHAAAVVGEQPDLGIVHVHAVGDAAVGAQHAQVGQVLHGPLAGGGQEVVGVHRRRRHVEVE